MVTRPFWDRLDITPGTIRAASNGASKPLQRRLNGRRCIYHFPRNYGCRAHVNGIFWGFRG